MEKTRRRDNKLSITRMIIICLLLLLSICINAFIYFKNNELGQNSRKLMQEYENYKSNNMIIDDELNKYYTQIEFLKNIQNETNIIKTKVFKNIKTLEDEIKSGKSKKKIAYLTFDDGPYYLTYDYLKVLDKYNVKATFFTIGTGKSKCYDNSKVNCYPVLKAITDGGHTIANHTYSHAIWKGLYSSADSFMNSLVKQEELIKSYTGVITNITRFPGGSSTPGTTKKNNIIKKLRARNYGWVDWTASNGDGGGGLTKDKAWKNFTGTINSNIEVVLLHDYSSISLSLLPKMIEYLRDKDYVLLPLFYESSMINK